jgi:cell wall-associated NlpC family hydrolase
VRITGLFLAVLLSGSSLGAQGIAAGIHGQLGSPTRMQYSLGWLTPRWTLFEASLGATLIHGSDGDRYGGALDLSIGQSSTHRWYGVASIAGGPSSGDAESPWGGWSAGLGWRLLTVGSTDLSVEGRYLHLWRPDDAFVLGGRIATRWGGKPAGVPPTAPTAPTVPTVSTDPTVPTVPAARSAVATAIEAMGTPYLWGGSAANGFDCSGLIQYAYLQAGVSLPRRSVDQAKAGQLIPRDIGQLQPGDILTFSREPGGPVSHVGLYVGDLRFIHSASNGVRLSLLSETDPNGRHWMARWIGVRRIGSG